MSEIVNDLKISTLEITSTLGLNLTGDSARIKHEGPEGLTIVPHNNPAIPAALVRTSFGHSGTTTDFDVTAAATNAKTQVWYDWRMGNLAQVSALVDLTGIVNTNGTDDDVIGFTVGAAGEILRLPVGTTILSMTANVTQLSNAAEDTYSIFAHTASINEDAAAAGTELLSGINASSNSTVGVKVSALGVAQINTQRFIFLANDDADANTTSAVTPRTQGKILLTIVLGLQA